MGAILPPLMITCRAVSALLLTNAAGMSLIVDDSLPNDDAVGVFSIRSGHDGKGVQGQQPEKPVAGPKY